MSLRHKFMSLPYYYYDLCRVSAQLSVRTDRLMSRANLYRNALRSAQLMRYAQFMLRFISLPNTSHRIDLCCSVTQP
jgi:hypothetical protein